MSACCGNNKKLGNRTMNHLWLVEKLFWTKKYGTTFLAVKHLDGCPHDNDKIWQMTLTKIEKATLKEIKTIKNNPSKPIELD
ncbi:hypothetical protein G9A89_007300 [Geosiphon pyriformis]|nr:hypothetical protein G9A89_007300 [Geosiphon pyriformis]